MSRGSPAGGRPAVAGRERQRARWARATLVLVLAAPFLAAPKAAACSLPPLGDFARIDWVDDQTVLTNQGFDLRYYHPDNHTWGQGLANVAPVLRYALSPDRQWLVYASGAEVPTPSPAPGSCDLATGSTDALNLGSGQRTHLLDRAASAVAAGGEGVVVADRSGDSPRFYAWGAWASPRAIAPSSADVHPWDPARIQTLALAQARPALAIAAGTPYVHFLNATTGKAWNDERPTYDVDGTFLGFSSDARTFAFVAAGSRTLSVVDLDDGFKEIDRTGFLAQYMPDGFFPHSYDAGPPVWDARGLLWPANPGGSPCYGSGPGRVYRFLVPGEPGRALVFQSAKPVTGGLAWARDGSFLLVGHCDGLETVKASAWAPASPFVTISDTEPARIRPGSSGIDGPGFPALCSALAFVAAVLLRRSARTSR